MGHSPKEKIMARTKEFVVDGVMHTITTTALEGDSVPFVLDGLWCGKGYAFMYSHRISCGVSNGDLIVTVQ